MIWLIKSGHFSNTEIHGYFTNAEDAYTYIATKNNPKARDSGWDYYVDPIEEIKLEYAKRPRVVYTYVRDFYYTVVENTGADDAWGNYTGNYTATWRMIGADLSQPDRVALATDAEPSHARWKKRHKVGGPDYYHVEVDIYCPDPEKASKIAQDVFYQVIAKNEGLSI